MGSLITVVSKNGIGIFDVAIVMLEALEHRGSDAFGVGSSLSAVSKPTLSELQEVGFDSPIMMGHGLAGNLFNDKNQPIKERDFTIIFEGQVYPIPQESSVSFVVEELRNIKGMKNKALHIIQRFNGAYVFAIAENNKVVVGRDPLGIYPLYLGESEDYCAVATERKALWRIGIAETRSFPPGCLAYITKKGFSFETGRLLTQPPMQELGIVAAARQLKDLLLQATTDCTSYVKDVVIAFSGGLDSSIVALLASLCNLEVHLIYVSLEGQEETTFAEQAADALDMPLRLVEYSAQDIVEVLPEVIWLIEEPNPVNASIAVPMFWVAKQVSKHDFNILISGQGADELFGGYHRYLHEYAQHGSIGLRERLFRDVISSADTNFPRDNKLCTSQKIELRMPFADWNVTQFSLSLPTTLKVTSPTDVLRKRVLRKMAEDLGLPKVITEKAKKAIQYTTGVNHAIRKFAKKEGLTIRQYIQAIFLKGLERTE